jgi:hypothetical protein
MRSLFKYVIGASALFIAGCSAYFSVKGMGLLFMGSAAAVMVMAASMEMGKLVAASFLYQYWRHINIVMRFYLSAAVIILVAVTSLGIYGYLARAYEETNTHIKLLESQIASLEQQKLDAQRQISASQGQFTQHNDAARADIQQQQQRIAAEGQRLQAAVALLQGRRETARQKRESDIKLAQQRLTQSSSQRDAAIATEESAIGELREQLAVLDKAVEAYTAEGPGGFLKNDGIRRGQALRDQQKGERQRIADSIETRVNNIASIRTQYAALEQSVAAEVQQVRAGHDTELARIDAEEKQLRDTAAQAVAAAESRLAALQSSEQSIVSTGTDRADAMRQRSRAADEQIASLRAEIAATDIGSYRFVARAFGAEVDDVVKWLIFALVAVFDPLAVVLTVGFNVALMRDRKPATATIATDSSSPTHDGNAPAGQRFGWAPKVAIGVGALLLAGGVSVAAYAGIQAISQSRAVNHASLIPADSFAVVTLKPSDLASQDAMTSTALATLGLPLPADFMQRISKLAGQGIDASRDVYLFAKYPATATDAQANPVLILGVVAATSNAAAAEAALSEFAESLEGVLLPRRVASAGVANSRSMVTFGKGSYLDPEGGFFTFGLSNDAAIIMVELEGDPQRPIVEDEMRLCLGDPSTNTRIGQTIALPARATQGDGAVSVWFDARQCFAQMPKNNAAQVRHQQLQRFIDFDLLLTMQQDAAGRMRVAGDYRYAVDKFGKDEGSDVQQVLASLGGSAEAGTAGALMDQCAGVLDFEALILRLRSSLSAGRGHPAQVVVQKSVASPRQANFLLEANFSVASANARRAELAQVDR